MKYHNLRIAWSLVCGIPCLILILLWLRSYSRTDHLSIERLGKPELKIHSLQGQLVCSHGSPAGSGRFNSWSLATGDEIPEARANDANIFPGFAIEEDPCTTRYYAPDWPFILLLASFSGIPWINTRFSLRTLLIAMAVAAIAIGLVVTASR